ncbi:uncharacterized protein MYCFIDRAFT_182146 [Pseudocercospora fijiensis CIRAD86]|uniref:Uncharacterized protein n=1 Tax=Pseudocercospora fijiensis (strain CIRAD86) TaxID=383855 RepID=M2ZB36_PSEFD|nr:uncharacterized protein MYCFIDRAFT_182146 [Pseudocercospora fijiensis CIRAD86]EME87070.1 hypothetical protein MYCFIDRAFT_182146 [Pseudocercospora fijiensis CIRAD86]
MGRLARGGIIEKLYPRRKSKNFPSSRHMEAGEPDRVPFESTISAFRFKLDLDIGL